MTQLDDMADTNTTKRLIGYARVSTPEQNLDQQLENLRKAGVEEPFLYSDKASGAGPALKREGLLRALKALRPDDVLIIWKLDRLGRSLSELIKTIELIKGKDAELRVLTQPIDTTTAAGKLFFHMIAAFAEFERDLISERTIDGMKSARRKGKKPGTPKKYTSRKHNKAVQLRQGGMSYEDIAKELGLSRSLIYLHREDIESELSLDVADAVNQGSK